MNLHVLPGDSLTETFNRSGIEGDVIVCRECLVEGEVRAETLEEFWKVRASFLDRANGEKGGSYLKDVAAELEKLRDLPSETEVNLWFENELFCQTNMWFCLSLLRDTRAAVNRVFPVRAENDVWKGFGDLEAEDLADCFSKRKKLSPDDIKLGADLWDAYQNSDHDELLRLLATPSECFPFLEDVVAAEIAKDSRPKKVLKEIEKTGLTEFTDVFAEFSRRAGVYGFGDSQVKKILGNI